MIHISTSNALTVNSAVKTMTSKPAVNAPKSGAGEIAPDPTNIERVGRVEVVAVRGSTASGPWLARPRSLLTDEGDQRPNNGRWSDHRADRGCAPRKTNPVSHQLIRTTR